MHPEPTISSVLDRMTAALASLTERWGGRRAPKAFYLSPADWAEFTATDHPTVSVMWGNNPPKLRADPAFNGVPVRQTKSVGEVASRLYDHASYGHTLPPSAGRVKQTRSPPPLPADQVFAALDALSRTRALTDRESLALEAAMKGKVLLSQREAVRLGLRP